MIALEGLSVPHLNETSEGNIKKMMEKWGFHLVIPARNEKFEGSISYAGLTALPNYKKKIDKAVEVSRLFLDNGVFILDDFGNDSVGRRAAQAALQEDISSTYGDEIAQEYSRLRDFNLLSSGTLQQLMMYHVLDVLGNGLIGVDTAQSKRTREIMATFPKIREKLDGDGYDLSDPKFQWMVDLIAHMELSENEVVTESIPYRVMSYDQKIEIVKLFDGIARDFLRLVIRPHKKDGGGSVSGSGSESAI